MYRSGCGCLLLLLLTDQACADQYEVLPISVVRLDRNAGVGFGAIIVDNAAGLVVECGVEQRSDTVKQTCYRRPVEYAIKSNNIKSHLQVWYPPLTGSTSNTTQPVAWQIDMKTGELQFCFLRGAPASKCILIDWKNAPLNP